MLRIDDVQLTNVAGLRFNVWTSLVLFVLAAVVLRLVRAPPTGPRDRALPPQGARDRAV